ncbi:MAG TPA: Asp-tRNA(Asn)/Glu-tRNA(Gln) amidotransferase subunit GatC [Candidatus Omnitrophota bacterium]|nr:Asp-tRNA(Asn)/Glu-tRNA(Gln) amidotransferase subunit GatC [Candidatus Omnitrophota bacterium]
MKIDVDHVAKLARLGLTEEEKKLYGGQLARILDYAETLNNLKTEGIEPTTHAIPMKNVMREDAVHPFGDPAAIMANAPQEESGMFLVPRIVE